MNEEWEIRWIEWFVLFLCQKFWHLVPPNFAVIIKLMRFDFGTSRQKESQKKYYGGNAVVLWMHVWTDLIMPTIASHFITVQFLQWAFAFSQSLLLYFFFSTVKTLSLASCLSIHVTFVNNNFSSVRAGC